MSDEDSHRKQKVSARRIPSHFLRKAIVVAVVLMILPVFPSEAPDFFTKAFIVRSWELLHLVFVGIAVTYGLFGRRNDAGEKEGSSKLDIAQSYVSGFFQIPSSDNESAPPNESGENHVQSWNSQYTRKEPMVVMAATSVMNHADHRRGQVPGPVFSETCSNSPPTGVLLHSFSRENSSKRFCGDDSQERTAEDKVLRSPIPWRSRSGKWLMNEGEVRNASSHSRSSSAEDCSPGSSGSQHPRSVSCSNKKLPPPSVSPQRMVSPELLLEPTTGIIEDKKTHRNTSSRPPPPPPPLPPQMNRNRELLHVRERSVVSGRRSLETTGSRIPEKASDRVILATDGGGGVDSTAGEDNDGDSNGYSRQSSYISEDVEAATDVDRKADEFISRFRAQIRLQRASSVVTTEDGTDGRRMPKSAVQDASP